MEIGMRAIALDDESRVAEVRRLAVAKAKAIGFLETEVGRVAIVATELATNLLKHARQGEILISVFDDGEGAGVECLALDRGPGIADVAVSMRDGHSTAGSPGTGLGAIARQSHVLDIYSSKIHGSAILARVYRGDPAGAPAKPTPATGVVCLPMAGEDACGDAWSVRRTARGLCLMVADGLGHGPLAATASHAAVTAFEAGEGAASPETMQRLHTALRPTRGAAASIAVLPTGDAPVAFIGVGNVAGAVVTASESKRMVSHNGTLGHALKTIRPFSYPTQGETLVVLASDGLGTAWSLDSYPGLRLRHPSLIAGVLYRDFSRRRDDVTVLVARRLAP
jgi:anti-sigma regulatory factor (Ser/Thr protein kinase)